MSKFKVGDKVRRVKGFDDSATRLPYRSDLVFTVSAVGEINGFLAFAEDNIGDNDCGWFPQNYELVKPAVTVEQIREFVNSLGPALPQQNVSEFALEVLDFIDNGPKKPTAEEIVRTWLDTAQELGTQTLLKALREHGHLKD